MLFTGIEAGALWDAHLTAILAELGWTKVEGWSGVFINKKGGILVVYVDDILLAAAPRLDDKYWQEIEKLVEFKEPAAPITRYLGAQHKFDDYDGKKPDATRMLEVQMEAYIHNAVDKFMLEHGGKLSNAVTSPFIPKRDWSDPTEEAGRFTSTAASYAATLLFLARVCRPDCSVAVQRLCSCIHAWTVVEDAALTRLMAYLQNVADLVLQAELGPTDLDGVELHLYSDSDWAGDDGTTRSTSGVFVEFASTKSNNCWPLSTNIMPK